jgi:copper(I)-binding protein
MARFTLPEPCRPRARAGLTTGLCAAMALTAACSSTYATGRANPASANSSSSPRGTAAAGTIRITGAYLPQPASADVAAAYFTIEDTGDQADLLISATSAPAAQAALMHESTTNGAESMATLTGGLPIPAHGQVALAPDGYHLMLMSPATPLKQGGIVTLTLHFQHAGTVTLKVPVTSLLSDAMTGMPGM